MRGLPATQAAATLGMRRVAWVRIEHSSEGTRCQVAGIGHRMPIVRPVPMRTAAALVADGVPVVVSRREVG